MNQKSIAFSTFKLNANSIHTLKSSFDLKQPQLPQTQTQSQFQQSTHSMNRIQRKQTTVNKMTAGACLNLITLRVHSIFNMEQIMIEDSSDQVK